MGIDVGAGAQALGVSPASMGLPILPPTGAPQLSIQPPMAAPGQGAAPQAPEANESGAPYGASILSSLQAKGSPFVRDLAKFTEGTAKAAPPGAMQQPGTWAKSLVGGALSALGGVTSSLGDVAHANDNYRPGQGGLSGIANVMAARNQRQAQQTEQQSKLETEKALRAETFARTLQINKMIQRQDEQDRQAAFDRTSKNFDTFRDTHDTKENLTKKDIDEMAKQYITKDDPTGLTGLSNAYHIGQTREDMVYGADGEPQIDPKTKKPIINQIFTAQAYATKPGAQTDIPLSKEDSADLKRIGVNLPPDSPIDSTRLQNLLGKVGSLDAAHAGLDRDKQTRATAEQKEQADKLMNNDEQLKGYASQGYFGLERGQHVTEATINGRPADVDAKGNVIHPAVPGLQDQIAQKQAANPNDPSIKPLQDQLQKMQDLDANINKVRDAYYTKDDVDKLEQKREAEVEKKRQVDETERQRAETERHDRAEEANKAQEVQMKKLNEKANFKGDPTATTPEAFLNSLDPDARAAVQLVGTGRAPLSRPDYILARNPDFLNAVAKAYPDFDMSKVKSYQDAYKDFTSGKTADSLQHGSIAIGHLQRLKQINDENPIAVHNPATAAYKEYNNLLDTVAGELIAFYHEPSTNESRAAKKSTLGGLVNRDAAIQEQAKAMAVKLDSFKTRWNNAAPSAAYQAQMPDITPQAKAAIQTLLGGQQQQPAAPKANPFRQQGNQ